MAQAQMPFGAGASLFKRGQPGREQPSREQYDDGAYGAGVRPGYEAQAYTQGYQARPYQDPHARATTHHPRYAAGYPQDAYDAADEAEFDDGYEGYEDYEAEMKDGRGPGIFSAASQFLGAATSLAIVIGVSVWGYQLIMRDVSGVPIVRATEGPMRIAPEAPGGAQALHQGLSVNEVAGRAGAVVPADEIRLAPPPVDLTEDDLPAGGMVWAETEEAALSSPAAPAGRAVPTLEDAAIQALADQIAADVTTPAATPASAPVASLDVIPGAWSLRPQLRPANLVITRAAQPASATPSVVDLDPAALPPGTRLVQLGAFDSIEEAQDEWTRVNAQFSSFFADKRRVIERAEAGGRVFFRLRAEGFADLGDARRFCAVLVSERTDCIPVLAG